MLKYKDRKKADVYCKGCANRIGYQCLAFKEHYFLWKEGPCPAKMNKEEVKELEAQLKWYAERFSGRKNFVSPVVDQKEAQERLKRLGREEILSAYYEDVNRQLQGPPTGDKSDRTHKTFTKESMKDNRFIHFKNNPRKWE